MSGDHDHPIRMPSALTRRQLLQVAAAGMGVAAVGGIASARSAHAVSTRISLPGFSHFADAISTFRSGAWFLVEVTGALPDHTMMVGITSWQQQIPLPQDYTGAMAWKLPARPVAATHPISLSTSLRRQAVALAVNGVPIFNALNNTGTDSFLAGELDDWGGHCGRGDDYHYHVAPLHLEKVVGPGVPIAYALDGYPIYGATEPNGSAMRALDTATHGHVWRGSFHYHGTSTYPYTIAAMRGKVTVNDDMISPQPVTRPVRPPMDPLPGAHITGFTRRGSSHFRLTYVLDGKRYRIRYRATMSRVQITYISPDGSRREETYERAP